jgi:hypothetical protein
MSAQPTNEECADMFRVMMGEMMRMHPHYLKLKYKFEGLQRHLQNNPGGRRTKPDIELIRHYVNEMAEEFRSAE